MCVVVVHFYWPIAMNCAQSSDNCVHGSCFPQAQLTLRAVALGYVRLQMLCNNEITNLHFLQTRPGCKVGGTNVEESWCHPRTCPYKENQVIVGEKTLRCGQAEHCFVSCCVNGLTFLRIDSNVGRLTGLDTAKTLCAIGGAGPWLYSQLNKGQEGCTMLPIWDICFYSLQT